MEDKLFEACYMLAVNFMWDKDTVQSEKLLEHIGELNRMTDRFIAIAMDSYMK